MSSDESTPDTSSETAEPRRLSYKELMKERRKDAYQKVKAKAKADRIARKASPAGKEEREKQKAKRREIYLKAKAAYKSRQDAKRSEAEAKEARETAEEQARKANELMSLVTTANKLKTRPGLRLVKND